jgi:hypothetical protein
MGDLQVCGFPTENGHLHHHHHHHNDHDHHHRLLGSGQDPVSPSSSSNPDPGSIVEDNWERAEEVATEIVYRIHPTVESSFKRKQVIDYVQRLIRYSLGFEVFFLKQPLSLAYSFFLLFVFSFFSGFVMWVFFFYIIFLALMWFILQISGVNVVILP